MTLFITGSESFVGKHLINYCEKNSIDYVGVDILGNENKNKKNIDIRDKDISKYIPSNATIIHLAAISSDGLASKDPEKCIDVNIKGTINLLKAAEKKKAKKIIFASTEWVYNNSIIGNEMSEDLVIDIKLLKSVYAVSKLVSENLINNLSSINNNIILRFGIIYAKRSNEGSALETIFNTVRTNNIIEVGSKKTSRKFIHIDDIISGIILSLDYNTSYEIFNLSGNQLITLENIIFESEKILNKKVKILEKNADYPSIRNPTNKKIKSKLGWAPQIDLKNGLLKLL